jgi:hypothetical protein
MVDRPKRTDGKEDKGKKAKSGMGRKEGTNRTRDRGGGGKKGDTGKGRNLLCIRARIVKVRKK